MQIARLLVLTGSVLLGLGLLFWIMAKCGITDKVGKLPGDIHVEGKNLSFYFPIATSILLSLLLSLISSFWSKWHR